MLNMQKMAMFVAVVEAGSFTVAARTLQKSKAVISFNIRQLLEAEFGVALLLRSTRRLMLTQAGEIFYQHSLHLLDEARKLKHEVQRCHQQLTVSLRITSTADYAAEKIIPALIEFSQCHAQLSVSMVSSSSHADLLQEGFDLAICLKSEPDVIGYVY